MEAGHSPPARDPTLILFLGLFMILLAFFIMLTSLATVDMEKSMAAMESVSNQFGGARQPLDQELRTISEAAVAEGFYGQIESSFNAVLPVAEFLPLPQANALQVTVPASALFAPGEPSFGPRAAALLDRLADSLTQAGTAQIFEIEVFFEVAGDAPGGARELARFRAGAFAREIVARGVAPGRVSTGVEAGEAGKVRIFFIERPEERQKITLEP